AIASAFRNRRLATKPVDRLGRSASCCCHWLLSMNKEDGLGWGAAFMIGHSPSASGARPCGRDWWGSPMTFSGSRIWTNSRGMCHWRQWPPKEKSIALACSGIRRQRLGHRQMHIGTLGRSLISYKTTNHQTKAKDNNQREHHVGLAFHSISPQHTCRPYPLPAK